MKRILLMPRKHWFAMQKHVSMEAPLEACGLLAGVHNTVETVLPVQNAAQSPVKFRMDSQEQFNSFEWIEANRLDLVGIYHSHPMGPLAVSASDIAEAAYEVVNIIWSPVAGEWNARGFWIKSGRVSKVSIEFDVLE
jgi:[CysO sulfur-carrier protein]-S-L-cysteine hydrolase